ncbi:MAG TPA: DUF2845 domain-containing protein [Gammaproteobacteria bacterium]|nr:DUF2845 domain-containing protein [Gammaproteobacteria bacterium]
MRGRLAGLLFTLAALLTCGDAAAMRCGSRLIQHDDLSYQVARLCGEPDYIDRQVGIIVPGFGVLGETEEWYYNRGPQRLVRILTFRNGHLIREETAGYGFTPKSGGGCSPQDLRRGMSKYELLHRCGPPDHRESHYRLAPGAAIANRSVLGVDRLEEWVYDFGSAHFHRIVRLVNGRVEAVELGDRGG